MNNQDSNTRLTPFQKDFLVKEIGGELSACRLLNIDHHPLTANQILSDGRILSVQTTMIPSKPLTVRAASKDDNVDIYLLTVCDWPAYTFIGWATKEEAFNADLIDYGMEYGEAHTIEQSQLHPFEELPNDITDH